MAHHTLKKSYESLEQRLNRFPQGAPPSELLHQILQILFTEREAELVSLLPIKPFTPEMASKLWKLPLSETEKILDTLADKAILLDTEQDGKQRYILPPPMAGFIEFSLMRLRGDVDQKLLAELYYQYITVEEDFIRSLMLETETSVGRVFVQEPVLPVDNTLQVLDFERASHIMKSASHIGVGMCYCRHKKQHLGMACDAPMDICMTFNNTANSLINHGFARRIDSEECIDLLHLAYENNLVQFGENVRQNVTFICNCCGCCCEALTAARKFGFLQPVATTNYLPEVDEGCTGCGKCVSVCPVGALSLVSANDPKNKNRKIVKIDESVCLGCGVCVNNCPQKLLHLKPRDQRVITPVNSAHRTVLMAIEKGMLQNLIFDNHALWNHRVMAAILGVILKLPPVKQIMASKQMKSKYLDRLLSKMKI